MPKNPVSRLASAIKKQNPRSPHVYGVWQGTEAIDANLSRVMVPGSGKDGGTDVHRFVPRGSHVTGLVSGDVVLCAGSPLCIIAKVVGSVSLAQI